MRTRKLSDISQAIKDSYLNNPDMTIRKLGEVHNCSPGTIRSCLVTQGIKLRSRGRRKIPKIETEQTAPPTPADFQE